jgi:hypothetical protein
MRCFVIMPYRKELHFMYLFLKSSLEREFSSLDLLCERADKQAMTGLLTDKIARSINSADVIIADCTGANPNVFYELGIAHALGKPTVLLTADTPEGAPTDLRGYEFIPYELDDERSLLADLTQALQSIFVVDEDNYEWATQILSEYSSAMNRQYTPVSKEEFDRRVSPKLARGEKRSKKIQIMLPEVIVERLGIDDALAMRDWIDRNYGANDVTDVQRAEGTDHARAAT